MPTAIPEVSIALAIRSARNCASDRAVFLLGGRVLRAVILFSRTRAHSETTGRSFSSPSSSVAGPGASQTSAATISW